MDNATALSLARITAGAAAWATPELSLKVAMLDATAPQAPYLMRLFGVRDVALGATTLLAEPGHKPALLALGILVDAADAAAGVLAVRTGAIKPPTGAALTGMALCGVMAGVVAISRQRRG